MAFLEWLIADALDGMLDATLALGAGGVVWVVADALRSLL